MERITQVGCDKVLIAGRGIGVVYLLWVNWIMRFRYNGEFHYNWNWRIPAVSLVFSRTLLFFYFILIVLCVVKLFIVFQITFNCQQTIRRDKMKTKKNANRKKTRVNLIFEILCGCLPLQCGTYSEDEFDGSNSRNYGNGGDGVCRWACGMPVSFDEYVYLCRVKNYTHHRVRIDKKKESWLWMMMLS